MANANNPFETLEGRRMLTAITGTSVKTLTAADGTQDNGNNVVITFDGPIKSADPKKISISGNAINPTTGKTQKVTIAVKTAKVSGNTVTLRTASQVSKGAQITLGTGALVDAANAAVTGSTKLAKGLSAEQFTLARRQFVPTNKAMFASDRIKGGVKVQSTAKEPSAATVEKQLNAFLDKKVKAKTISAAKKKSTINKFKDAAAKTTIPSANLRAALLSLVGTVGEPAISFYLDGKNSTGKTPAEISFNAAKFSSGAKITDTTFTSKKRIQTIFNPAFAGESFVVLSPFFAHEVIHDGSDKINSQDEEVIANTVEMMVYGQQILVDPTFANNPTTLTTRQNYHMLMMLNSGDKQFPRVGIKAAPLAASGGVAPGFVPEYGKQPIPSFDSGIRAEYAARNIADKPPTASTPAAQTILTNITGNKYTSSMTFGDALIDDLDAGQDVLTETTALQVAKVLQLKVA